MKNKDVSLSAVSAAKTKNPCQLDDSTLDFVWLPFRGPRCTAALSFS